MRTIQTRAPKFKRKPRQLGGVRLQERDIGIIRLVHDYRFLNSDQIKLLADGSEQGISRRLQKLFHHSFLDRPPSQILNPLAGAPKMVYALGDRGADLLADKLGIDRGKIRWGEKNRQVKERHIHHTLMISNFRMCLETALDPLSQTQLLFWEKESRDQLRDYAYTRDSRGRRRELPIVPDGFFGINDRKRKHPWYFFLEADQSTMSNGRFLDKMKAYWEWGIHQKGHTRKFGIKGFRVLTITKTEQRKENLRKITKKADDDERGSFMFWFTSEQRYTTERPETILGPIWQTSNGHKYHSILEQI